MKLHEFQKESNRLCKAYRVIGCEKCPLHKCHCATYRGLTDFAYAYDAVSAWSDSHPIKTRQSEFLKKFPKAKVRDGVISLCPQFYCITLLGADFTGCTPGDCAKCLREYWLSAIDESKEKYDDKE